MRDEYKLPIKKAQVILSLHRQHLEANQPFTIIAVTDVAFIFFYRRSPKLRYWISIEGITKIPILDENLNEKGNYNIAMRMMES